MAQSILADSFPVEKRGLAFSVYGITAVCAPAIGPTLGGWLTDNYSWALGLLYQHSGRDPGDFPRTTIDRRPSILIALAEGRAQVRLPGFLAVDDRSLRAADRAR